MHKVYEWQYNYEDTWVLYTSFREHVVHRVHKGTEDTDLLDNLFRFRSIGFFILRMLCGYASVLIGYSGKPITLSA